MAISKPSLHPLEMLRMQEMAPFLKIFHALNGLASLGQCPEFLRDSDKMSWTFWMKKAPGPINLIFYQKHSTMPLFSSAMPFFPVPCPVPETTYNTLHFGKKSWKSDKKLGSYKYFSLNHEVTKRQLQMQSEFLPMVDCFSILCLLSYNYSK